MVKALADRLAEAFAEYLHEVARREWYETGEQLSSEDLIAGALPRDPAGVRLPGLPRPQREAEALRAPRAEEVGLELTESFAMLPAAAVSGVYLAHPEARYFCVGRIGRDQVEDYAARKGIPLEEVERWLAPNLCLHAGSRSRRYPDPEDAGRGVLVFPRMKTTLKRGIGRAAELNGNGRAVYPPADRRADAPLPSAGAGAAAAGGADRPDRRLDRSSRC